MEASLGIADMNLGGAVDADTAAGSFTKPSLHYLSARRADMAGGE